MACLDVNLDKEQSSMHQLPDIPVRGKINMIVRDYAKRTGTAYANTWSQLYRQLYYRNHYDVQARCRHSGKKKLDQIEADGKMETLLAIASAVLAATDNQSYKLD
jgi:hypothetical protein